MTHPEYGKADDRPALCAGISYAQGPDGAGDHRFKLHFNDWEDFDYS